MNFNVVATEASYRICVRLGLGVLNLSCTKSKLGDEHLYTHMDRSLEAVHP